MLLFCLYMGIYFFAGLLSGYSRAITLYTKNPAADFDFAGLIGFHITCWPWIRIYLGTVYLTHLIFVRGQEACQKEGRRLHLKDIQKK